MLKTLFSRKPPSNAKRVYDQLVARARHTAFFTQTSVPDTLDGRFELMVLHLYLIHERLKDGQGEPRRFSQEVFDAFIDDMDAGLREAAVGDQTVPKRINKMTKVFYGRVRAYDTVFESQMDTAARIAELTTVMHRNLFPDADDADDGDAGALFTSAALAQYLVEQRKLYASVDTSELTAGKAWFEGPPALSVRAPISANT
ncbi:MAG: ubiquinol-cytochrome C chaperone family protein [Pseudomonadota bacterium]